jgi:hypothetical protein
MLRGMPNHTRQPARRLACNDIRFVEADFPRPVTPRLILTFDGGLSILLEKPDDIDLACELIASLRARLNGKGGRAC